MDSIELIIHLQDDSRIASIKRSIINLSEWTILCITKYIGFVTDEFESDITVASYFYKKFRDLFNTIDKDEYLYKLCDYTFSIEYIEGETDIINHDMMLLLERLNEMVNSTGITHRKIVEYRENVKNIRKAELQLINSTTSSESSSDMDTSR